MADVTLVAEPGRTTGSRPSRRLRSDGRIPAVVYGNGVEPVAVSVSARDLRSVLSTGAGLNAVLALEVGRDTHMAMAREIQRHPVRGTVTHVDFQVVDPDQPIVAEIPVVLVGDPVELHHQDGMLDQQVFSLTVKAKPADLPPQLEADVSGIVIGTAVRVGEVILPPGVVSEVDADVIVAIGQAPRMTRAEEAGEGEATSEEAEGSAGSASAGSAGDGGES